MGDAAPVSAMVVVAGGEAGRVEALRESFRRLGFAVGPFVGVSFAISGGAALFRTTFGASAGDPAAAEGSLPLAALPEPIRNAVAAILLPNPPEWH